MVQHIFLASNPNSSPTAIGRLCLAMNIANAISAGVTLSISQPATNLLMLRCVLPALCDASHRVFRRDRYQNAYCMLHTDSTLGLRLRCTLVAGPNSGECPCPFAIEYTTSASQCSLFLCAELVFPVCLEDA